MIGTAGAVRNELPARAAEAKEAKTNVYGSLLATVEAGGDIRFDFREISEGEMPADAAKRLGPDLVHECFAGNSQAH